MCLFLSPLYSSFATTAFLGSRKLASKWMEKDVAITMNDTGEKVLQSRRVLPGTLEPRTFILSPIDLFPNYAVLTLVWPVFFNYDVDGERFVHSLSIFLEKYPILCGRLKSHPEMRFVVEVVPQIWFWISPEGLVLGDISFKCRLWCAFYRIQI